MLRKRTRSHQKAQMISGSDSNSQSKFLDNTNQKSNPLFGFPNLFIGLNNKGLSDYDSVWSPTSPLDFRVFSNTQNPFAISPRSLHNKDEEISCKVGLGIVNLLEDDADREVRVSGSKNILFSTGMRIKIPRYNNPVEQLQEPGSVPQDSPVFPPTLYKSPLKEQNRGIVFEIGDDQFEPHQLTTTGSRSSDSCSPISARSGLAAWKTNSNVDKDPKVKSFSMTPGFSSLGSSNGYLESLSESEIELSEDYTCIISHGPNPKTTRIYEGRIINSLDNKSLAKSASGYRFDNFLSFCHSCNRKLEEEKDIYIYRGEMAFCSSDCRLLEIMNDEEKENKNGVFEELIPVKQ